MSACERIQDELNYLYSDEVGRDVWIQLEEILIQFIQSRNDEKWSKITYDKSSLSQDDIILITYADQIFKPGEPPLSTLGDFLNKHLSDNISSVHILSFYPYSTDDGFSVIDYYRVNQAYGDWENIEKIGEHFRLMFDAVINHISRRSEWFQAFLRYESPYYNYFITVDPATDLSAVVRPRDLPVLTSVETAKGEKYVWTTFSDDQIDLNYSNPQVLLEIIKLLLFYVGKGANFIRLDAIAYLWKEAGTTCIHLPQTHSVIRILRAVLDKVAPYIFLITETNVPHQDNISYFGKFLEETKRSDEAQLVYQFPLAPLILNTFYTGNAVILSEWVGDLGGSGLFFNFIASHDGIGVMPAKGLLNQEEIQLLVDNTIAHNGSVSYKVNPDGSKSVYELNITLYDALNDPNNLDSSLDIKRFLASQAIMLSLAGVPGIYFHSLFGLRNCNKCVEETKRSRSINREKISVDDLEKKITNPNSITKEVFDGYSNLLRKRRKFMAFHPEGSQSVLSTPSSVFGLLRKSPDGKEAVVSIINVTDQQVDFHLKLSEYDLKYLGDPIDFLTGKKITSIKGELPIKLTAYQIMWISLNLEE